MKHFTRICLLVFVCFIAIHITLTFVSEKKQGKQSDVFSDTTKATTEVSIPDNDTEAITTTETTEALSTVETTEAITTTETTETTEEKETTEQKKTTEEVTEDSNQTNLHMQPVQKTNEYETYIFVGDSRFVQMESYAEDDDTFICENGVGYRFLSSHMDEIVSLADSDTKIVIGLGVNDVLSGPAKYTQLLYDLASRTDAQIYYMLINPVDDELCAASGYAITNADIDDFNIEIQSALVGSGIKIIDVNSYLKTVGYTSRDGLHYNASTSRNIYVYIKEQMLLN